MRFLKSVSLMFALFGKALLYWLKARCFGIAARVCLLLAFLAGCLLKLLPEPGQESTKKK